MTSETMTAKNIARAKVFILDWDGVLAETQLDFAPLRQKYFGGERVPLIEAAAALPAPLRAEVEAEIYRVEMGGAERAAAVEGAKDLLAWLTETRRPWSVVSRNCRDSILLAAQRCGIVLPPVVLSREEPYVKPAPEALALAAERMGAKLRNCVMVGDFVHDLQAAQNAGIPFVLVKASGAEWERNANFTYPTVTEFVRDMKRNFSKSDD